MDSFGMNNLLSLFKRVVLSGRVAISFVGITGKICIKEDEFLLSIFD